MKGPRVEPSSVSGGPLSATLVANHKNVFVDLVSNDAQEPAADSSTTLLESALYKCWCIFQCLIQELLDHFEQGGCDVGTEKYLIPMDPPYNLRDDLKRQISDYDEFSGDDIAEMMEIPGSSLKLKGRARIFYFAVQFSF